MANGMLENILGYDPVKYQQDRLARILAPMQGGSSYRQLGAALGTIGSRAFGGPDPQLEKISKIKQIQATAAAAAGGDRLKALETMRDELLKDPELSSYAMNLDELIEKAQPKGGKISLSATDLEKIDPKDRARVIQTFQSTGKLPEDLSFIDKPKKLEDSLKFFKENPEQATFRLQELSQLIEADPNNKDYIKEFEQISAAASAGAKEKYDREQKNIIDNRLTNLRINKYTQDISDAEKLSPGARWNAEIDAARTLLNGYNIDPSKPLQSQKIPASVLYGPAGASIVDASQKALRKKTTEKEPAPVKPKPETKVPQELESALKAANIPYEPTKYDYRIVNGAVQRKPKGK